jgi:hypothetical protein
MKVVKLEKYRRAKRIQEVLKKQENLVSAREEEVAKTGRETTRAA